MRTKIISSEKCLAYGEGHLESPRRIKEAAEILKERGYQFLEPQPISEKNLLLVHKINYLEKLKKGEIEDIDTPAYKNIYEYAKLTAGGALLAAKVLGFSLMRPPGHHVGKTGSALGCPTRGFCYLNNIALAVKSLNQPTLILDIDGHHGNGTEEIFFGDKKVIYLSLHRFPFYPGSGGQSQKNCFNFPLAADCGEEIYLRTLKGALNKINWRKITIIAVSVGFDTHCNDLASLGLTEKSFRKIGRQIAELNKSTFFVLEGGYLGQNIGNDADELIKGFENF